VLPRLLPPNPEGDDVRLAIEAFHLADDGDPCIIDEGELCIIDEGERSIAGITNCRAAAYERPPGRVVAYLTTPWLNDAYSSLQPISNHRARFFFQV